MHWSIVRRGISPEKGTTLGFKQQTTRAKKYTSIFDCVTVGKRRKRAKVKLSNNKIKMREDQVCVCG